MAEAAEITGWHSAFFFAFGLFFVGLAASLLMPAGRSGQAAGV